MVVRFPGTLFGILSLSLVLLFSSCTQTSMLSKSEWTSASIAALPAEKEYPDAAAIVLENSGTMEVFTQSDLPVSTFEHHRTIRILTTRGEQYANIVIPYSGRSEVSLIEARTISPDGHVTPLDASVIYDVTLYPNFIFYSDQRAKIFTMPAVEKGCIVEYRYQLTIHDQTLWHAWNFQEAIPTLSSRFSLVRPSEWSVISKSYGPVSAPEITNVPAGFRSTHVWEMKNIPALKTEFFMPNRKELLTRIAFSPVGFTSWQDVARWFHGLWTDRMKPGRQINALAGVITSGASSDEEKLRRIFEWVQANIRYMAVEIGIGGHQPHDAEEIFVNRYGDCKDMTTLLCAFAKAVGIELYPAFISSWFNGKPDTSLPSPFHFDHVIAFAPSSGNAALWMDATEKSCPFGQLPWYDQGLPVLVVGKEGAPEIHMTPRMNSESNMTAIEWSMVIDTSGMAIVSGSSTLWGDPAAELQNDLMRTSLHDQRKWLEILLAKQCSGAALDSFSISGVSPLQRPLKLSYSFKAPSFARFDENQIRIQPGTIAPLNLAEYFRSPSRTYPIRFQFGERICVTLSIKVPDGYAPTSFRRDSVVSSFGKTYWSVADQGTFVVATKEYHLQGEEIPPDLYLEFQKFLDNIQKNDAADILLQRKR